MSAPGTKTPTERSAARKAGADCHRADGRTASTRSMTTAPPALVQELAEIRKLHRRPRQPTCRHPEQNHTERVQVLSGIVAPAFTDEHLGRGIGSDLGRAPEFLGQLVGRLLE